MHGLFMDSLKDLYFKEYLKAGRKIYVEVHLLRTRLFFAGRRHA